MSVEIQKEFPKNKVNLLSVNNTGYHRCEKGHSYGPAVRDHYLIHFVLNGSGSYYVGETCYSLKAGQGFLIEPDVSTFYQADWKDPWEYCWLGFNGRDARAYLNTTLLYGQNLVFTYVGDGKMADFFREIGDISIISSYNEAALLSRLFYFFSLIERQRDTKTEENGYVEKAAEYIGKNYSYPLSVGGIAGQLGLNRSYFYKLFQKKLGISPQQYLLETRLTKACEMLSSKMLNITEICFSCGFSDPAHFSAIFRRKFGKSPKQFREGYLAEQNAQH